MEKRRKVVKSKNSQSHCQSRRKTDRELDEKKDTQDSKIDHSSVEESSFLTAIFSNTLENEGVFPVTTDSFDFTLDKWLLQEDDCVQDHCLADSLEATTKSEIATPTINSDLKPFDLSPMPDVCSDFWEPVSTFFASENRRRTSNAFDYEYERHATPTLRKSSACRDHRASSNKKNVLSPESLSSLNSSGWDDKDINLDPSMLYLYSQYPDPMELETGLITPDTARGNTRHQAACNCHEITIRELVKIESCVRSLSAACAIETLLKCQNVLKDLAQRLLQCSLCSNTQSHLLVMIVLVLDSLLTSFEGYMFAKNGLLESATGSTDSAIAFKAQVECCQLSIGDFQVPAQDKVCFIKYVLHSRLSALLGTIRQIKMRAQQSFTSSFSKGRLVMIMETDRRLQLLMMKIKLLKS